MCIGIHTYKIGIIYLKNRAAKLKKWCVYVCGKRGGVELHIGLEIQYIYIIFDFCFTSFETFFFRF